MIEDWQETRIEDIAERIAMGPFGSDIKTDNFVPQGVPIIRGGNLTSGRFNDGNFVYLTEEKADKLSTANAYQDDIIFTHRGTLGQVGIIPKTKYARYVVSQSQMKLTCKKNLADPSFIYYFFKSSIGQQALLINTSQTGVPAISRPVTSLKSITILLPKLPEQRRIAHILGTLDDKIENNRKTAKTLEDMAQAIFQSWFVDFDPVRAKMSGESKESICKRLKLTPEILDLFPDRLVDSELGQIPEGWSIKNVSEFIQRASVGTKYDSKSVNLNGLVPVLDQGKSGIIGYHNNKPDIHASSKDPIIIFANHTCYMRLINYNFSVIQNVLPFRGRGVDTIWAYFATKDRVYFTEYKGHWPDLMIEEIAVPRHDITTHFREAASVLMNAVFLLESVNGTLVKVRDILLPKLISGEIRVPEAEQLIKNIEG